MRGSYLMIEGYAVGEGGVIRVAERCAVEVGRRVVGELKWLEAQH